MKREQETDQLFRPLEGLVAVLADNPGPLTLDGTRSYVIGRTRLAVLDPGPDDANHLARLVEVVAGRPVEAICLTHSHRDHSAAAAAAAGELDTMIAGSSETLRRVGLHGRALDDGDQIALDGGQSSLGALATPGHSADHLCYVWGPDRVVFTGDLVLGHGTSVIVHPDGAVGPYLASLARLASLRPSVLVPGHGEPIRDPASRLEEIRLHRLMRDSQILDAVADGARTPEEIRRAVYGDLDGRLNRAAELSVLAHLAHLQETGHELPDDIGDAPGPVRLPAGERAPSGTAETDEP